MRVASAAALALAAGCLQSPPSAEPVVVFDAEVGPDATPCPPADGCVIDPASGHTYAAFLELVRWSDAELRCQQLGWYLATDRREVESVLIQGLLDGPMWIGATDVAVEDSWEWRTGESFDYTHWRSGEPNGETAENCALANWEGEGWNDLGCLGTWAYVCETGPLEL